MDLHLFFGALIMDACAVRMMRAAQNPERCCAVVNEFSLITPWMLVQCMCAHKCLTDTFSGDDTLGQGSFGAWCMAWHGRGL